MNSRKVNSEQKGSEVRTEFPTRTPCGCRARMRFILLPGESQPAPCRFGSGGNFADGPDPPIKVIGPTRGREKELGKGH